MGHHTPRPREEAPNDRPRRGADRDACGRRDVLRTAFATVATGLVTAGVGGAASGVGGAASAGTAGEDEEGPDADDEKSGSDGVAASCPGTLDWDEVAKLDAFDRERSAHLGSAVATDGETAVVGADADDHSGTASGAAYVYARRVTRIPGRDDVVRWIWQDKLVPEDGDADDEFGAAVALEGDTAVVGVPGDEDPNGDGAGAVYVFERCGWDWDQRAKLTAGDGDAGDGFGAAVALDGETLVVGAAFDEDPNGEGGGAAYVFTHSSGSWNQAAKLTASDGEEFDGFGSAVAADCDAVLVGAEDADVHDGRIVDGAGKAYVFERSGGSWTETATLVASDAGLEDRFGHAVALDGTTALVGASQQGADEYGAAYVFERSGGGWSEQTRLESSDRSSLDNFGSAVALDGSVAVIGAKSEEQPNGTSAGAAYAFERTSGGWSESQRLAASDGDGGDEFGTVVALQDGVTVVGAPWDDGLDGDGAGSAYVYEGTCQLPVDVVPGTRFNVLDRDAEDTVPVEVLATETFDPRAELDVDSLRFGSPAGVGDGGGAEPVHSCPSVDGGLLLEFPMQDAGFEGDEDVAELVGETTAGRRVSGTDEVRFASEFEDGAGS